MADRRCAASALSRHTAFSNQPAKMPSTGRAVWFFSVNSKTVAGSEESSTSSGVKGE